MDWVQCPSCQLKHRPREDGTCPRCRASLFGGAAAAVVAAAPPVDDGTGVVVFHEEDTGKGSDTAHMRMAGLILICNAAINVFTALRFPELTPKGAGGFTLGPSAFDLVIGVLLLAGRRSVLPLALFRAVAGWLLFTGMAVFQGDLLTAVIQTVFTGALVMLLWGRPGAGRLLTGVLGGAACLVLGIVGLALYANAGPAAFADPGGEAAQAARPQVREGPPPEQLLDIGGDVSGYTFPIEMERPARSWQLRPAEHALESDRDAQFWWVEPRSFAHLRIRRHESASGEPLDLSAAQVSRAIWTGPGSWEGMGARPAFHAPVDGAPPPTAFEALSGEIGGEHRVHVEVHRVGDAAWSIVYSAPPAVYDEYLPEVRQAVAALEF